MQPWNVPSPDPSASCIQWKISTGCWHCRLCNQTATADHIRGSKHVRGVFNWGNATCWYGQPHEFSSVPVQPHWYRDASTQAPRLQLPPQQPGPPATPPQQLALPATPATQPPGITVTQPPAPPATPPTQPRGITLTQPPAPSATPPATPPAPSAAAQPAPQMEGGSSNGDEAFQVISEFQ